MAGRGWAGLKEDPSWARHMPASRTWSRRSISVTRIVEHPVVPLEPTSPPTGGADHESPRQAAARIACSCIDRYRAAWRKWTPRPRPPRRTSSALFTTVALPPLSRWRSTAPKDHMSAAAAAADAAAALVTSIAAASACSGAANVAAQPGEPGQGQTRFGSERRGAPNESKRMSAGTDGVCERRTFQNKPPSRTLRLYVTVGLPEAVDVDERFKNTTSNYRYCNIIHPSCGSQGVTDISSRQVFDDNVIDPVGIVGTVDRTVHANNRSVLKAPQKARVLARGTALDDNKCAMTVSTQ